MQGPLGAAPRFAGVDGAAVVKEYTVPILGLHLYRVAGLAPICPGDLLTFHAKVPDHSFLVIYIQRNRGFPMAAVTALLADEYV